MTSNKTFDVCCPAVFQENSDNLNYITENILAQNLVVPILGLKSSKKKMQFFLFHKMW